MSDALTKKAAAPKSIEELPITPVKRTGAGIITLWRSLLVFLGETASLTGRTISEVARGRMAASDLVRQMALLGADSIWVVLVVTTATGIVFAVYTATLATSIGFSKFVGGTLAFSFLNELGPLLGGVAFAARAGAAIAAEIGTMVVTEQVDALRAMAVSPVRYLVAPRVVACIIMLPLLIVFADVSGLIGSYYAAGANGVAHQDFVDSVLTFVRVSDLTSGLIKAVVFGFIIGIVACQQGLRTTGGATGVGRSTTSSVVLCVLLIFVSDIFLAEMLMAKPGR